MENTYISKIDRDNLELLDLSIRNVRIYGKKVEWSSKDHSYNPILKKGDIVECEFTGIGNEINLTHFAIVWSAKANSANINIIPLTSKFKDESKEVFTLENIDNFYTKEGNRFVNKESFVYLNKLMEVSRKRIKPKYKQDSNGRFIQNRDGSYEQLSIGDSKIKRIEESFRLFYLNEGKCIVDIICSEIHIDYQLCITNINENVFKVGYRLVDSYKIYEINLDKVIICHIDGKRYSLYLKRINYKHKDKYNTEDHKNLYKTIKWKTNIRSVRNKIIEALFTNNSNKIDEAKKILQDMCI